MHHVPEGHPGDTERAAALVIERHQIALVGDQLEVLRCEPPLRGVQKSICLARFPRDAREREPRPLPDVVVIDLGDRTGNAV